MKTNYFKYLIAASLCFAANKNAFAGPDDAEHIHYFLGQQIDQDNLMRHMRILSGADEIQPGLKLSNRYSVANRAIALDYIARQMAALGYELRYERATADGLPLVNLVAEKKGTDNNSEYVEVVTHYDSQSPVNPGADDNLSGVTSGLEMARVFRDVNHKTNLRFVFTDLEERGLLGAEFHATQVEERKEKIKMAFIVDTVGYFDPAAKKPHFDFIIGGHQPNREFANAYLAQQAEYSDRPVSIFTLPFGDMMTFSDVAAYFPRRWPAIFVRQSYEQYSPTNHSSLDKVEFVNAEYMTAVIRSVGEFVSLTLGTSLSGQNLENYKSTEHEIAAKFSGKISASRNLIKESNPISQLLLRYSKFSPGFRRSMSGHFQTVLAKILPRFARKDEISVAYESELAKIESLAEQLSAEGITSSNRLILENQLSTEATNFDLKWGSLKVRCEILFK